MGRLKLHGRCLYYEDDKQMVEVAQFDEPYNQQRKTVQIRLSKKYSTMLRRRKDCRYYTSLSHSAAKDLDGSKAVKKGGVIEVTSIPIRNGEIMGDQVAKLGSLVFLKKELENLDREVDEDEIDTDSMWSAKYSGVRGFSSKRIQPRTFGVELETVAIDDLPTRRLMHFSGVPDGSINGDSGVEIVSRKLSGDEGLNFLRDAVSDLNAIAEVDSSCGFHVHVNTQDLNVNDLKRLYLFLRDNEDLFLSLVPPSRRGAEYTRRMEESYKNFDKYPESKIDFVSELSFGNTNGSSKMDLRERKYSCFARYCWANFATIPRTGSVEIRSHNGTLNPTKVIRWVQLWVAVVSAVKNSDIAERKYSRIVDILNDLPLKEKKPTIRFFKERWNKFNYVPPEKVIGLIKNLEFIGFDYEIPISEVIEVI